MYPITAWGNKLSGRADFLRQELSHFLHTLIQQSGLSPTIGLGLLQALSRIFRASSELFYEQSCPRISFLYAFPEEMKPAPRPTVSAPSSSVLRFLRSQSEQACFFTLSPRATACQRSSSRVTAVAPGKAEHALPSFRRHLATSSHCQAYFESSLLNLDFLRPYSERGSWRISALASRKSPAPYGFSAENMSSSRYVSSDNRPLWKRPWKGRLRKEKPILKSNDSPALPTFLDDAASTNSGRRKTVKGANGLKLRCTEFDENGNVTFMDGEFRKSELIAKVCPIQPMCEKKLDSERLCSMVYSLVT